MICPTCSGAGESRVMRTGEGTCWRCKGKGELPDPEPEDEDKDAEEPTPAPDCASMLFDALTASNRAMAKYLQGQPLTPHKTGV